MKRLITEELKKWKNDVGRKPLILRGARQVGKTYILKQFAVDEYDDLAYFNFDHDAGLADLFVNTKDPVRIIEQLGFANGRAIVPGRTLIFFDEIQECPDALNSLKYFYENTPEYHVVCAGSLLGIRLSQTSFPVGKVNFLNLYPMSFTEFLMANGKQNLIDYMKQIDTVEAVPEIFATQLTEELKKYYIIGGMPEAVKSWTENQDLARVNQILDEILTSYEIDFSKHTTNAEANKIALIWDNIPSQLARENKKFLYQAVKEGARAREYEGALNWLSAASLVYKLYNVTKPALPLKSYRDLGAFKIYLGDVGLLRRMSGLEGDVILQGDRLFTEFKGALTENYIVSVMMRILGENDLSYLTFDRNEIDLLLQYGGAIVPAEIKSGLSGSHASLTKYVTNYQPDVAVRFSMNNLKRDGRIINIPLYLAEYVERFL